ncbi:MAG: hypothetical protein HQM09_17270 [Candidatus Riflebacteria bacterium]|nr:hypothetical protein [Candidatus Riflebacteria bacterium]
MKTVSAWVSAQPTNSDYLIRALHLNFRQGSARPRAIRIKLRQLHGEFGDLRMRRYDESSTDWKPVTFASSSADISLPPCGDLELELHHLMEDDDESSALVVVSQTSDDHASHFNGQVLSIRVPPYFAAEWKPRFPFPNGVSTAVPTDQPYQRWKVFIPARAPRMGKTIRRLLGQQIRTSPYASEAGERLLHVLRYCIDRLADTPLTKCYDGRDPVWGDLTVFIEGRAGGWGMIFFSYSRRVAIDIPALDADRIERRTDSVTLGFANRPAADLTLMPWPTGAVVEPIIRIAAKVIQTPRGLARLVKVAGSPDENAFPSLIGDLSAWTASMPTMPQIFDIRYVSDFHGAGDSLLLNAALRGSDKAKRVLLDTPDRVMVGRPFEVYWNRSVVFSQDKAWRNLFSDSD